MGNRDEQLTESSLLAFYMKLGIILMHNVFNNKSRFGFTNINLLPEIFLKIRANLEKFTSANSESKHTSNN